MIVEYDQVKEHCLAAAGSNNPPTAAEKLREESGMKLIFDILS